jgi:hypothetical protein
MKYFYVLLLFTMVTALNAAAVTTRIAAKHIDTAATDTDTTVAVRKQSLSVGINYGSDALFFGRTGPIKFPFVSTDAVYNTKNGFFAYGSLLKVLGYDPFFDELDLGGGYLFKPSKNYTGSISYTRFIFNKNAHVIKSGASNDLDVNNSYKWFLKSGVSLDALFGKSHDYFVTISNSKYFESKFSIFDDKDYLTFTPGINIILGTQNFVQRYSLDHQYLTDANNIFIQPVNEPYEAHENGMFNMLNYSFKLPIAYNRPHYTLEFAYKYSIPVNVEGALMNRKESFYNLTFYYVFY